VVRAPAARFRTVVFDCDSTLSTIEGIEELAVAHRDEIARLTEAAMRGEIPLEQVYGRRLALVRPSRAAVDALGRRYVETAVPDAREVVAALRAEGVEVRVISGGLTAPVAFLARELGLEDADVRAVDVRFDDAGEYAGFDEHSPLARSGGKLTVMRQWGASLPRPIMLVGDGATDLEARPAVDCFVAFAGVVARPNVVGAADVVIRAPSLAPVLPLALGGEPPADPSARPLVRPGGRDARRGRRRRVPMIGRPARARRAPTAKRAFSVET
jgi:phosphoserine phosphatase